MIRGSLKGKITYLLKFDLDNLEQSLSLLEEGDFNYKLPNDDLFIHENIIMMGQETILIELESL